MNFGSNNIRELNKAYWVAEYWTLVRPERYAINAADAMPLLKLSADTTSINAVMSCPCPASQANSRLLAALRMAPSISTRMTPKRIASAPPIKAPASVITTPYSLVTPATSSFE